MKSTLYVQGKKGFQFKRAKVPLAPGILRPAQPAASEDGLTGSVHGKDASDIEEYFAKALDKFGISYTFQRPVQTDYSLPDQDKQVDFVVYHNNRVYPVELYGSYFHTSAGDMIKDMERERQLNDVFRRWGWEDLQVVWDYEAFDAKQAELTVRRMFL